MLPTEDPTGDDDDQDVHFTPSDVVWSSVAGATGYLGPGDDTNVHMTATFFHGGVFIINRWRLNVSIDHAGAAMGGRRAVGFGVWEVGSIRDGGGVAGEIRGPGERPRERLEARRGTSVVNVGDVAATEGAADVNEGTTAGQVENDDGGGGSAREGYVPTPMIGHYVPVKAAHLE
ncbi:hypothetical protein M427DRAFT_34891 [Gonapodya prolifera JEL478]|uniref:Uncharacterized protein n=1 Tax=Gonapodya prolifera (strain JEL478) TaxID=1344416 RepID=A0A139A7C9_GONPJ|nr:hypothetical protein M427DRAFT_34891 [Gonapodya prolifera JEL478]|eukprot:KXS12345.1 hypothetical protein M427DRAFT_34891 [Gonapodya prolifera JEL478]